MCILSSNCIQYRIVQTLVQHLTQAWQAVERGVKHPIPVNEKNVQFFVCYFDIIQFDIIQFFAKGPFVVVLMICIRSLIQNTSESQPYFLFRMTNTLVVQCQPLRDTLASKQKR